VHTDATVVERLIFPNCGPGRKLSQACGEAKSLAAFLRNLRSSYGRTPYCKPCHLQRQKVWRVATRERYLALTAAAATKTCRRCAVEQPVPNFDRQIGTRDDHFGLCKACAKTEALSRQLDEPETHRRTVDRWTMHRELVAVRKTSSFGGTRRDPLGEAAPPRCVRPMRRRVQTRRCECRLCTPTRRRLTLQALSCRVGSTASQGHARVEVVR